MEFKKIPVYCPRCKTRVLYWNGITKMQIATKCKGCGRYVIYNPEVDETKVKPFEPERQSASGKRFY